MFEEAAAVERAKLELEFRKLELQGYVDDDTIAPEDKAAYQEELNELMGDEERLRQEKEEADRQRQEKVEDQARIAKEQREQRIAL